MYLRVVAECNNRMFSGCSPRRLRGGIDGRIRGFCLHKYLVDYSHSAWLFAGIAVARISRYTVEIAQLS